MRGVLGPAVELLTFGSPEGLPIPNFSKCWASPPHLAKLGLRHKMPTLSPHVLPVTNGFLTKNQMPFSQSFTTSAPLGSGHIGSGVPMGGRSGHLML
jgi:hypothetical protein